MKSLSIIIPMYNVAAYVERCLRSIEDQNISKDDYEIICVNDGSPDDSRRVVLRLQKEFDNIILIDQENHGVSSARNRGVEVSQGKYLLFIDPDDYLDIKSLNRFWVYDKDEIEVCFLGFTFLNINGAKVNFISYEKFEGKIYSGLQAYFLSRGTGQIDPDRIWGILFNKDFIIKNHLFFLSNVPYLEDGELIARILCLAQCCIFVGGSFYQRTTRPGSATNSSLFHTDKATKGFLAAAKNLKRFQQDQKLNGKQKEFLNQPIAKFVLLAVNSSIGWGNMAKLKTTLAELNASELRVLKLESCCRLYKLYSILYNLSPYISAIALVIFPKIKRMRQFLSSN